VRAITITLLAAACWSASAQGQTQNQDSHFLDRAEVQHSANSAMVVANSPRPLEQAMQAVSEEYGWTIDFEDPPYSSRYDVVDSTAPAWRAQHPSAKGVTLINGGAFQSQYPEGGNTLGSVTKEESILNKLVSDYNQSPNPGKFSVRYEGQERFSITGTTVTDDTGASKQIRPLLDVQISIPSQRRDGEATLQLILSALSAETRTTVFPGLVPLNLLIHSMVVSGGQNVPARTLLQQVLSATGQKLSWELLYDTDGKAYYLSLLPVKRAEYDAFGNRTTLFVK
jgi:hypothetical protein